MIVARRLNTQHGRDCDALRVITAGFCGTFQYRHRTRRLRLVS